MLYRAVCALLVVSCLAGTAIPARAGYLNGAEYLELSDVARGYYIIGLYDMLDLLAQEDAQLQVFVDRVNRCTEGMSSTQLRDFVDEYMYLSDMDVDGYSMASNFSAALNESCPP